VRLKKLWYHLTKYWPRPIPKTEEDFKHLKEVLMTYFGVEDSQVGWITVASEIQNTRTKFLRKPIYLYANACKKIEINGMCENQKRQEGAKLTARLKEIAEKVANESVPEGPHDSQEHVQVVS
jgi:hypothetical protein